MIRTLALWLALGLLVSACAGANDGSPVGLWKTIDDKTHRPRGFVRIYEQNGELFGKIVATVLPEEAHRVCEFCTDERKKQPVVGMVILKSLKKEQRDEYSGGNILDPETGWVYRCKARLIDGGKKLLLRGYLGVSLLGRSQVWLRAE